MKLRQLLPREIPEYMLICCMGICPTVTVLVIQTGNVAASVFSSILTLISFSGYVVMVYLNIQLERSRQRRELLRDQLDHRREQKEMMK